MAFCSVAFPATHSNHKWPIAMARTTTRYGMSGMSNVLADDAARWEPFQQHIQHIKQFYIEGEVEKTYPLESFGSGNQLFKFVIRDGNKPESAIVCKVWGNQAIQYANLIKSGNKYRVEAVHVNQTRKQDYGVDTKHVCELTFSKETLVHALQ